MENKAKNLEVISTKFMSIAESRGIKFNDEIKLIDISSTNRPKKECI